MKYDPHLQLKRFLQGPPEEREDARQNLLAMGERAVPYILETLAEGSIDAPSHAEWYSHEILLAGMSLLVEFKDSRSLWFLLRVTQERYAVHGLFHDALNAIARRGSPEDVVALLDLLRHVKPRWKDGELIWDVQTTYAVWIATAVVQLAERDPRPELRAALPMLTLHPFLPVEFVGLHRRLKAALARETLPIPASASPSAVKSLPIPVEHPDDRV
jgi:hypothetical protein